MLLSMERPPGPDAGGAGAHHGRGRTDAGRIAAPGGPPRRPETERMTLHEAVPVQRQPFGCGGRRPGEGRHCRAGPAAARPPALPPFRPGGRPAAGADARAGGGGPPRAGAALVGRGAAAAGGQPGQGGGGAGQLPQAPGRGDRGAGNLLGRPCADHPGKRTVPQGHQLHYGSVRRRAPALPRPPHRPRGRAGGGDRPRRNQHRRCRCAGPCGRLLHRPRHDRARAGGAFVP